MSDTGKLLATIVVGIVLAAMVINGLKGCAHPGSSSGGSQAPSYYVVPCSQDPTAIGC